MSIARLIRTAIHLKPSQVFWRLRYTLERKSGWMRVPPVPEKVGEWNAEAMDGLRTLASRWGAVDPRAGARAAAFRAGRFEFLHETADFSGGIDWASASRPRLWRYQLHYFDCAKELALAPQAGDTDRARAWMRDWITKNPPVTDVAWDGFTISARVMNWALAAAVFGVDDADLRTSFLWQARYLSTHLELDVQANHLLKNACALCVAGALLAPALVTQGLALLREQLDEQILPDGGHYERTPMYHALVLEDLLLVQAALGPRGNFLEPYIARMADFLAGILHPDGEIPFFGDSALGESRTPSVLLGLAGHTPSDQPETSAFPDSGYYVFRDPARRLQMIIKAGAPGPAYQLGHAHADCLSYELSVDGERVIVNCGVHGYADSPHRAWCRSEAAHNTFEVVGKPQLELWGAFRAGRRYAVPTTPISPVRWLGEFTGRYTAFGREFRRMIRFAGQGFSVADTGVLGEPVASRIHLAPGFEWKQEGEDFLVVRGGRTILILTRDPGARSPIAIDAEITPTHYFPEFGRTLHATCLRLSAETILAYRISLP